MKKKFSMAVALAVIVAVPLTLLVQAAGQPAQVVFTTDAPCPVVVQVISYTDPANQPGQTASGSTPWTLDTYPVTSVTLIYPASVVCSGTTYNFQSITPGNPVTSGAAGSIITVTGHYLIPDTTPPVWTVPADFNVEAMGPAGAIVSYTASVSDPDDAVSSQSCTPASDTTFPLGTSTVNCTATDTHGNTGTASFKVTVTDTTPPALTLPSDMTIEASNASGAMVTFTASANDIVDGSRPVTCIPASGSVFPIGSTTVNCSTADTHGNIANGSFTVTVADTTPPTLTLPSNMTVEAANASGSPVTFIVAANDAVDGLVAVTCIPASGSVFPIGTTTVNCSATDSRGNTTNGTFTVTVADTASPALTLPSNITVEASSASGATVSFTASASDAVSGSVPVTCVPASDSVFPLGMTSVNCSAIDSHGNTASGSFKVTVTDTTPPMLTLPSNITVEASSASGATVSFTASASDAVSGSLPVACVPVSGSLFLIGTTTVNCSATDSHGNTASGSFNVTVVPPDTTPPVLALPLDMTVEALNASGATVTFTASANDAVDGPVPVTCVPPSGSVFPIGTTTVNCSATDSHNNTASSSFKVTVTDTTPPMLTLPSNMTVTALNAFGAPVNFTVSATDLVDGPVPVTCVPASGSEFPIGTTTVNCSATDSHGNTASGSFTIAVQYASGGKCNGVSGHEILEPIKADASSVFKAGSTVPAKFRVCGEDGEAITTPGVVTSFKLIEVVSEAGISNTNEDPLSTTPDAAFRSGNRQWIFNIDTKNLSAGNIYVYLITLNDGSTIRFQFALK